MAGMTAREAEMVERFEVGQSRPQIAAEMGLTLGTVEKVTQYYCYGIVDNGSHRRKMIEASAQLRDAIRLAYA